MGKWEGIYRVQEMAVTMLQDFVGGALFGWCLGMLMMYYIPFREAIFGRPTEEGKQK